MVTKVSLQNAANLFIMAKGRGGHVVEDQSALTRLLAEVANAGYIQGLQESKDFYRLIHSGDCKVLSVGEECGCFLCAIDKECDSAAKRNSS